MSRAVTQTVVVLAFFAAILFGSAGRVAWPMAWAYLGAYAGIAVVGLCVVDRDLIIERSRPTPGAERSDIILASVAAVWLFPLPLLIAGLDVWRLRWSPVLPLAVQLTGLAVFVVGNVLGIWTMTYNPFFSDFVRVQTERGHRVISSGPYGHVRHPGYAFGILALLAQPIALGSLLAVVPALIGAGILARRAVREERTLTRDLAGYADYVSRVRWRLLPGVW